ncbi:MAG: protein kinase [Verrucomicrobiales bacterium]|nr:protein kinase [Verrucomicrobiales bacterium]
MSEKSETESPETCPKCGAEKPGGAPGGLCPVCLMAEAMVPTADGEGERQRPEPPDLETVQAAFPQLEILELIGVGGMGMVYKARQTSLNREVALKLLAPHRDREAGFSERFTREAQALAAMNHPNIVTVHDFGQANDFFFLLMEFVDGVNLRQAMKAGKFTPEEALAIVPPICEALQYAHDRGIVHRDIKPENLLLDKDGQVKVADFGIARILHEDESDIGEAEQEEIDFSLTAGTALGTPNYMAPEQADTPETVDHRADIYSLGVVFYEMLTGEPPSGPLRPPSSRVAVDVRLDEIVLRALADSPELRWQSATDLRTQVQTIVENQLAPTPVGGVDPGAETVSAVVPPKKSRPGEGFRWAGIILSLISVPALLVGLVALAAVWDDPHWNPIFWEAIFVVGSWILALFFPIAAGFCFWKWIGKQEKDHRSNAIRFASGVALAVASIVLPVVLIGGLVWNAQNSSKESIARIKSQSAMLQSQQREYQVALSRMSELGSELARNDFASEADRQEVEGKLEEQQSAVSEAKHRLNEAQAALQTSDVSAAIPGAWPLILSGLFGLSLAVGALILLARSAGGVAFGCGLLVLLLFSGLMVLFLSMATYRATGVSAAEMQRETTRRIESRSDRGEVAIQIKPGTPAFTMRGAQSSVLTFQFQFLEKSGDWDLWQVTRYTEPDSARSDGVTSRVMSPGQFVKIPLRGLNLTPEDMDAVTNQLQQIDGGLYRLKPGITIRILNLRDSDGKRAEVELEIRPASQPSSTPKHLIYIREVDSKPGKGTFTLAWNEIQSVGGMDLVLEIYEAGVQVRSDDKLTGKLFNDVQSEAPIPFSRRILPGGGSMQFEFQPFTAIDPSGTIVVDSFSPLEVPSGEFVPLFQFEDPSGRRSCAILRMLPEEEAKEIPRENE